MVVDDDPSILITVKNILETEGVEVVTADSGKACVNKLEAGFKGVLLLDIMMPHMDGWDTIREIVARGLMGGNVISMLTAKDVPDAKMDGLQQYVIDYNTKPFEPERLIGAVDEYLSYLET
jgi:DNA-binding response OmpR family regulator